MALTPVQEAQVLDLIAQQSALLSLAGVEATILSKLGATKVTLSDLPTASVIDDADLLLLRQGVTDKSVTGLTFKNLIPSTITTPPQFDNDTSIANTEFVQRALGNLNNAVAITGAITLSAGNMGNYLTCSGTGYAVTLPLASLVAAGSSFHIQATAGPITIQRGGSDLISLGNGSTATSIVLNAGDSLFFTWGGASTWVALGGSGTLKNSAVFGSSLTANGYQKLPSGLILQWSKNILHTNGDYTTAVTFPIAFPNACISAIASQSASAGNNANVMPQVSNLPTASGMNIYWPTGQNVGSIFNYIAIGY